MYSQRKIKNKMLVGLRKMGFLKKQPILKPMKCRTITNYKPYESDIVARQHVYIQNKLSVKKNCKFDVETRTCVCGSDLDGFLNNKCK